MAKGKRRRKLERVKPRSKEPKVPVEKPKPKPFGLSFVKGMFEILLKVVVRSVFDLFL
jgi:hypothetical protein